MSKKHQYTKPRSKEPSFSFSNFISDRRFKLTIGLITMVFAMVMGAAFLSYFWSGRADQSTVESLWKVSLSDSGRDVQNWMGIFGAFFAYLFIYKWFGIASFLLLPLMFQYGYFWVTERKLFSERNYALGMMFWLFWLSTLFGYIALFFEGRNSWSFLCGGIGFELAMLFNSIFGAATVLVLLLALGIYAVFYYDINKIDALKGRLEAASSSTSSFAASFKKTTQKPYDDSNDFLKEKQPRQNPFAKKDTTQANQTNLNQNGGIIVDETQIKDNQNGKSEFEFNLQPPNVKTNPTKPILMPKLGEPSFSVDDRTDFNEATVPTNQLIFQDEEFTESQNPADKVPAYIRFGLYDPKLDLMKYVYPELELLHPPIQNKLRVTREELEANKEKIVETLSHFNISIDTIKATVGPTVTLYEIVPQAGIKISKIKNLEDDIALSLSALGIRIIAPIPGRGTIGIEVPNKNREVVPASSVFSTEKFQKSDYELPIVLGKTISNEVFVADLAKMPHLLMAGATGQGKSVGLNIILTSLLYKKHPSELKLVLVDPKKVELTLFNRIEKHFLAMLPNSEEAIITDTKKVVHTLNSLCIEMDIRYGLLKDAACRNIKEYNEKFTKRMLNPNEGHRYLPYIVLVIDELADLMMTAGKEVETPIARLAQLARAIGIHLIVATQRPSVNVITGIIKANFPARLSFKVASKVDSRTILDTGGADQLIGQGDMLLSNGSDIIRLQCAFVATDEVEKICDHIGKQQGYATPYLLPEFEDENGEQESKVVDLANRDPMFEEAARVVVMHQQGSTSLIQRKLSLGYNRAGRLIDQLEAAGVVGAFEGSKARKVLVGDEMQLQELIRRLV
jgi:S-DNA-T family DNA segregation ATPase FtsK/SpoIIIE